MKISIVSLSDLARVSLVVIVSLFIVACDKEQKGLDPEEAELARVALVDWLECEECTENQLEKVMKHDKQLRPMLISTLHQGVAPASSELYRRELEKRYDELVEYSATHPNTKPTVSKQAFVDLYLANLNAQYKTRAAQALASIGGKKSRRALQQALDEANREDVKLVIEQSLKDTR
jgi:hypothetical protein